MPFRNQHRARVRLSRCIGADIGPVLLPVVSLVLCPHMSRQSRCLLMVSGRTEQGEIRSDGYA